MKDQINPFTIPPCPPPTAFTFARRIFLIEESIQAPASASMRTRGSLEFAATLLEEHPRQETGKGQNNKDLNRRPNPAIEPGLELQPATKNAVLSPNGDDDVVPSLQ